MKRGHVPRRAAQLANLGLFLVIVGVCGFVAWRASQLQVFVVPENYIAGYVEESGFLWKKKQVRVFSAGSHPVLENETAAASPAYRVGDQAFNFDATAPINVALWKDAKNLLTRKKAPIIRVCGVIEASVTAQTVEAHLLSDTPIHRALQGAVETVLAHAAKENTSDKDSLEGALLDGLEGELRGATHLAITRIRIDTIAEVDTMTPTRIFYPPDFVVETNIVKETPPSAYASVGLALLVGASIFVVTRILFADAIALILLTPFQWVGMVDSVHWRVPEEAERTKERGGFVLDGIGAPSPSSRGPENAPPTAESDPVVGPTMDAVPSPDVSGGTVEGLGVGAEAAGELAGGAADVATESAAAAVEGVGELAGGLAEGLAGGLAEGLGGCLGGIFG